MVYLLLFTVRSHYFPLSILSLLTLEIDFPIFNRRSSFYGLLKIVPKRNGNGRTDVAKIYKYWQYAVKKISKKPLIRKRRLA